MINENSISVIVPALNEERSLEATVLTISKSVKKYFDDYEIIIFDDGSTDRTGEIADTMAEKYDYVKTIHHKRPICIGGIYREGIKLARMNYLMRINGKNDITVENLDKILAMYGKADMIIPYTVNSNERSLFRRVPSMVFTVFLNTVFRLNLRYYNHYVLYKKAVVNPIDLWTDSYAFQAEILIKLVKSGFSYIEIPVEDRFTKDIKTKAFYPYNILGVVLFLFKMIGEVYIKRRY